MQLPSTLLLLSSLHLATATTLRHLPSADPELKPFPEVGFDLDNHDVASGKGKDLDACLPLCTARTDCKAYSWSDFNGGTCWLKSGRGAVKVDPNVQSASLWTQEQLDQVDAQRVDIDFVGNDLARVLGAVGECGPICRKTLGCRAFSWNSDNSGTCWLKTKRGQAIHKAGVISADAYPHDKSDDDTRAVETNTDYVGHDIANVLSKTYDGCFALCQNKPGCHVFSWSDYMGGTCWLKSWKEKTVFKQGVVSAVVSQSDREDCCQRCLDTPNCKAFAWSDFMGGTCWFKEKKDDATVKDKSGVFSGVVITA